MTNMVMQPIQPLWQCDKCGDRSFSTFDEANKHEMNCLQGGGKQKTVRKASQASLFEVLKVAPPGADVEASSRVDQGMEETTPTSQMEPPSSEGLSLRRSKRERKQVVQLAWPGEENDEDLNITEKDSKRKGSRSKHQGNASKKTKQTAIDCGNLASAMSMSEQEFLQQQRTMQFRLERQKEAEKRRERLKASKSRSEERASTAFSLTRVRHEKRAPHCPVPNHILPKTSIELFSENGSTSSSWLSTRMLSSMRESWRRQHRQLETPSYGLPSFTVQFEDGWSVVSDVDKNDDDVVEAIQACVRPSTTRVETIDVDLTADDFEVEDQLCGSQIQKLREQLSSWVSEWKERRRESIREIDDRHTKRMELNSKATLATTKQSFKADDDDVWEDSGDEDGDTLVSLCLLTGPCGSGKSAIVKDIADELDCELIEMNTTQMRSGADVRKIVGEATQSLSTFRQTNVKPHAFSSVSRPILVDDDASKHDLSVILIDEVDLVFEDNGDLGFWPALFEVSKRAQCPIFLTANTIPPALLSTSLKFKHEVVDRPSVEECAEKLEELIERHPFVDMVESYQQSLEYAVQVAKCDLRRLSNALEAISTRLDQPKQQESFAVPVVDLTSRASQLASESELLFLESRQNALPIISGAVRGFGFDLTEDWPGSTNSKSKRPREESLISSGWKEFHGFYGGCDWMLQIPSSTRERLSLRDKACAPVHWHTSSLLENDEGDELQQQDEESFQWSAESLVANHIKSGGASSRALPKNSSRLSSVENLVNDFMFSTPEGSTLQFFSRIHRPVQDYNDAMDRRLHLDYLPMIRVMALYDNTAFEMVAASADTTQHSGRQTRGSLEQGYIHYLGRLAHREAWRQFKEVSSLSVEDTVAVLWMQNLNYKLE